MENKCINCSFSRQVGDLSRTDTVGCAFLDPSDVSSIKEHLKHGTAIYSGFIYAGRRPGDNVSSVLIGKGAIMQGVILSADSTQKCFKGK